MKKLPLICALMLMHMFQLQLTAQTQKVKFRKIPAELLEQKTHPLDSQADAAILYQYCRVYYALTNGWFDTHTYVHKRIKIYNQDGMGWADFAIPYYAEGNFVKFKAYTYNLEEGKVVETKLENDNFNTEEFNKVFKRRKFAMPAVSPGSVIDIEYEISEPSSISLQSFYLQEEIPVDFVEYEVEIPKYYTFNKSVKGLPLPVTRKNDSRTGVIPGSGGSQTGNDNYAIYVDIYTASNVPALKEEPFVPSMNNYRTSINYELSYIQGSSGKITNFSNTWDNIAQLLMESEDFGRQMELRLNELNPLVEQWMLLPAEERVNAVYYYVRDNYNWNEYYGGLAEKGLKKLLDEKSGNSGDINLLLINLLKKVEVDVLPCVLSTTDRGFLNVSYPSLAQINYVIAAQKTKDGYSFLDATNKYLDAGFLPKHTLNLDGIIVTTDKKGIKIPLTNPNKGVVATNVLCGITDDLMIKGQVKSTHTQYDASMARSVYYEEEKQGGYLKSFHDRYPGLEITNHTIEGADSLKPIITERYDFELEGQIEEAGDLIYLNPMLIWQDKINYLKSETREFPVFYHSMGTEKYMISIKLPENYQVESLPKAVRLALPNGLGTFTYSVSVTGQNLTIQYLYIKTEAIIPPTEYQALKNLLTLMIDKQAEKVVLKRV